MRSVYEILLRAVVEFSHSQVKNIYSLLQERMAGLALGKYMTAKTQ